MDDDPGLGLSAGFHFNRSSQLGGRFNREARDYRTQGAAGDGSLPGYENGLESTTLGLYGLRFILPGNATPCPSGSVGCTHGDSNIQAGPAETGVYYDPRRGYTCGPSRRRAPRAAWAAARGSAFARTSPRPSACRSAATRPGWNSAGRPLPPTCDSVRIDFIGRAF